MRQLIGLLLIGCLAACTREEMVQIVSLPTLPRQPVVLCVLTPGDSVQVMLARPSALGEPFSTSANTISGATVQLTSGQPAQSVSLVAVRPGVYGASQRNFPIRPGQTYSITVQTPTDPVLTATCRVPARAAVFASLLVGQSQVDGSYESRRVDLTWRDVDPGNTGYFISRRKVTDGFVSVELSSADFALNVDNKLIYNILVGGKARTTYPVQLSLITADLNLTKFRNLTDLTQNVTKGRIDEALTGFKGILPDFTNIHNGLGFFGACVHTDTTLTIHD